MNRPSKSPSLAFRALRRGTLAGAPDLAAPILAVPSLAGPAMR